MANKNETPSCYNCANYKYYSFMTGNTHCVIDGKNHIEVFGFGDNLYCNKWREK